MTACCSIATHLAPPAVPHHPCSTCRASARSTLPGVYFPQAYVRIGNLSSSNSAGCLPIVGGTLDVGNLSSFRISVSNCAAYGTHVPA